MISRIAHIIRRKAATYGRSVWVAADGSVGLGSCLFRLVLGQPLLQVCRRLKLGLLDTSSLGFVGTRTRARIARHGATLSFGSKELVADTLVVRLQDVFRDAFHAKDFHVWR